MKVLVAQLCLTLCNPMDSSLPGSSVPRILQARILEWVAIPFSRVKLSFYEERKEIIHVRDNRCDVLTMVAGIIVSV